MFLCLVSCLNIVLLLSYSVSWPPFRNKHLLTSLLSVRPAVTFPDAEHRRPLAETKLYCSVTEAHRCEQFAQGCYAAFAPSRIWTYDLLIASPTLYPLRHLWLRCTNVQLTTRIFWLSFSVPQAILTLSAISSTLQTWSRWNAFDSATPSSTQAENISLTQTTLLTSSSVTNKTKRQRLQKKEWVTDRCQEWQDWSLKQGCGLGLDISASRRTNILCRSRLDKRLQRLGLVLGGWRLGLGYLCLVTKTLFFPKYVLSKLYDIVPYKLILLLLLLLLLMDVKIRLPLQSL